jgi:hypothetical protein
MSLVARVTSAVATVPSMHEEVDERAGQQQSPRKHAEDVRLVLPPEEEDRDREEEAEPRPNRKAKAPGTGLLLRCRAFCLLLAGALVRHRRRLATAQPAAARVVPGEKEHGYKIGQDFGSSFMPHFGHLPGSFS